MVCTFFGHSDCYGPDEKVLKSAILRIHGVARINLPSKQREKGSAFSISVMQNCKSLCLKVLFFLFKHRRVCPELVFWQKYLIFR